MTMLDCRGLEKALDQLDAASEAADAITPSQDGGPASTPRDARRTLMRERRAAAWRHLNVVERDVLIVITALCKVNGENS